jgi:regulator of sigma E protease
MALTYLPVALKSPLSVIMGLLGFSFLIAFHELGHFLFCKLFGIRTPSFSVGFGPRIFQKKIGSTVFALSAIPFGGYVEIAGAQEVGQGDQQEAQSQAPWSFARKPLYQKLLVLFGGILFNLVFAYGALTYIFYTGAPRSPILYPKNASAVIDQVLKDSPAQTAGLQPKDTVIAINNKPINNDVPLLLQELRSRPNQEVTLTIERDGIQQTVPVRLSSQVIAGKEIGILGTTFTMHPLAPLPFTQAVKESFIFAHFLVIQTARAFKGLFARKGMENIGGPIMVLTQTIKSASQGFKVFLLLLALISINLAVLNLVPLPILDGGQILFYFIEGITGRPLSEAARLYIHYASWLLVLAILVYLSYKDIKMLIVDLFK